MYQALKNRIVWMYQQYLSSVTRVHMYFSTTLVVYTAIYFVIKSLFLFNNTKVTGYNFHSFMYT